MALASINEMADTPPILRGDNGAATRLALGVLSALVVAQSAALVWAYWPRGKGKTEPAAAAHAVAATLPSAPASAAVAPAPQPSFHLPNLPPPPGMLNVGGAPAAPTAFTLPPPPQALPGMGQSPSYAQVPPPRPMPQAPATTQSRQAPAPSLTPAPTAPLTDDPEVNEIVLSARETIALNDKVATEAALDALMRADLLKPENPVVLREMALAYQKLGQAAKAKDLYSRANVAVSSAPRAPSAAPVGALDGAFAASESPPPPAAGILSIGQSSVKRDNTCATGENVFRCCGQAPCSRSAARCSAVP